MFVHLKSRCLHYLTSEVTRLLLEKEVNLGRCFRRIVITLGCQPDFPPGPGHVLREQGVIKWNGEPPQQHLVPLFHHLNIGRIACVGKPNRTGRFTVAQFFAGKRAGERMQGRARMCVPCTCVPGRPMYN